MAVPKFLLKLKSKLIYCKLKAYSEHERNHHEVAYPCLALLPELFEHYNVVTACIYYIESPSTNILELIKLIDVTITELRKNEKVKSVLIQKSQTVSLDNFFKDTQSRYVNIPTSLSFLKEKCLEYFTLYEDLSQYKTGIEGYNYRALGLFTQTLSALTDAIRKYHNV